MTATEVLLGYEIETLSPLHVGTGYGLAGILDAGTVRRMEGGQPGAVYVPGSSLKGRARYHLELMATNLAEPLMPQQLKLGSNHRDNPCRGEVLCPVCNLFGSTAQEGPMVFSDAHLAPESELVAMVKTQDRREQEELRRLYERQERTNVMLSRRRGVARQQHLFTTEMVAPGLHFVGTVTGAVASQGRVLTVGGEDVPADLALLLLALQAITHLGGRKSRGLGRCQVRVEVNEVCGQRPGWSGPDLLAALREVMP